MFEYIGEMGKDYIYAVTPLLEDALQDRDLVHRQTAASVVQHMALGVAGLGCEDALVHLMNLIWPNIFETSPHVVNAVTGAIDGMRMSLGPTMVLNYVLQVRTLPRVRACLHFARHGEPCAAALCHVTSYIVIACMSPDRQPVCAFCRSIPTRDALSRSPPPDVASFALALRSRGACCAQLAYVSDYLTQGRPCFTQTPKHRFT